MCEGGALAPGCLYDHLITTVQDQAMSGIAKGVATQTQSPDPTL